MNEKKVFAKGVSFKKIFLIFIVGCIIGVLWEESYLFLKRYLLDYSDTSYRLHRGLIYGPFNPVYGIAAAILTFTLCKKKRSFFKNFMIAFFIGGIVEYLCSFFQELIFGTVSWDYSNMILSIGGRTNILYMLFFALLGSVFTSYIYPYLSKYIEKIPYKMGNIIFYILLIFFVYNIGISVAAVYRQTERYNQLEPSSTFELYLDEKYPDEFLNNVYVNTIRK